MTVGQFRKGLFLFSALCIFGWAFSTIAQNEGNGNLFTDRDRDGLTDDEEAVYGTDPNNNDTDGDGYSDGIEIESGYSPLIAAPDDRLDELSLNTQTGEVLGQTDQNYTQAFMDRVARSFSDPQNADGGIDQTEIDAMLEDTIGEITEEDALPDINVDDIKVKDQSYEDLSTEERQERIEEDAREYLSAVSVILMSNSPMTLETQNDYSSMVDGVFTELVGYSQGENELEYFKEIGNYGEQSLSQLNQIEVPQSMIDIHIKGLQLAHQAVKLKEESNFNDDDPLRAMVYLSRGQNLLSLAISFSTQVSERFSQLGITEDIYSQDLLNQNQQSDDDEEQDTDNEDEEEDENDEQDSEQQNTTDTEDDTIDE